MQNYIPAGFLALKPVRPIQSVIFAPIINAVNSVVYIICKQRWYLHAITHMQFWYANAAADRHSLARYFTVCTHKESFS